MTMDTNSFRKALKRIGFLDVSTIKESSIRALFEGGSEAGLISWLLANLQDFEALSKEELEEFEKIKSEGKQILEISDIPRNLNVEVQKEEGTKSRSKGKCEKALVERIEHLSKQQKLASTLLQNTEEKVTVLENNLQRLKVERNSELKASDKIVHKLDEELADLKASLWRFVEAYKETNNFLSQLKFDSYFEAEDSFTSALTKYTKKQFFEGIADIVGKRDESKVELLDISSLPKGEDEKGTLQQSKELMRLQNLYPRSQRNYIESTCTLKSVEAQLNEVENQLSDIVLKPVHMSEGSLIKRTRDIEVELNQEKERLERMVSDELLPLLTSLGELESTSILCGNYDLKIARQDYFLSKQDEVIKHLIVQSSRYDLLLLLFEIEAKFHRQTYYLLSAIKELIESSEKDREKRIELMENPYFQVEDTSRETIDSRDPFVNTLYDIFESDPHARQHALFKSFEMLKENAEKWHAKNNGMMLAEQASRRKSRDLLKDLENELKRCEKLVFGTPGEEGHEESTLDEKIEEMDNSLAKFEASLKDVIREFDSKKKYLAANPLKTLERTLFPAFFQDPLRLRRLFSELESRAEATTAL